MGEKARDVNTFCTQCGTPNPQYEVFCGSCGMNMEKKTTPGQEPQPATPRVNSYAPPPAQMYGAPPPQMNYGSSTFVPGSYPVGWQDATKITIGVVLIIAGTSFGLFGFGLFAIEPIMGLIILLLISVLPIYVGYTLLKPFMPGGDMVKTGVATFLIGSVVYAVGFAILIIIVLLLFGGFYF